MPSTRGALTVRAVSMTPPNGQRTQFGIGPGPCGCAAAKARVTAAVLLDTRSRL